uniref:Uncharacterized protein n=1 Tax=Setaria italica TaxID=4555 RepID=K3Y4J6_SETIT
MGSASALIFERPLVLLPQAGVAAPTAPACHGDGPEEEMNEPWPPRREATSPTIMSLSVDHHPHDAVMNECYEKIGALTPNQG